MTPTAAGPAIARLPDHMQLPQTDGTVPDNFQAAPQSSLFTGCLAPRLAELFPDGQYSVGQDSFIYWRHTDSPLEGCKAPDWFLVVGVPPMLRGEIRRSYVLWDEGVLPLLAIEYVSGTGSEERDRTPLRGKFWVYERGIGIPYYAIFDGFRETLELHRLEGGAYVPAQANECGRFPVPPLRIELGLWQGVVAGMDGTWLRAWDAATGLLLPSLEESGAAAAQRAETAEGLVDDLHEMLSEETERAEGERRRAERLAERLRQLGFDPEAA